MSNRIITAARIAKLAHAGQYRKNSNRPYIRHPGDVVARVTLADDATENMVCAAWLHDSIEDTTGGLRSTIVEKIRWELGGDVLDLVRELTNPSKDYPDLPRAERKKMDRIHMSGCSWAAKVIKCADRACNLTDALRDCQIMDDIACAEYKKRESFLLMYYNESFALYNEALRDTQHTELDLRDALTQVYAYLKYMGAGGPDHIVHL